jgi:hypothetical protein
MGTIVPDSEIESGYGALTQLGAANPAVEEADDAR